MSSVPDEAAGGNSSSAEGNREHRSIDLHIGPAQLVAIVDGEPHEISPQDLNHEECVRVLREGWQHAREPIAYIIRELPRWDHATRWTVLRFIADTDQPYVLRISEDGEDYPNLFAAVLALIVRDEDPERCERCRRAAVEAAAFAHPTALRIACSQIIDRLQQAAVRGYRVETLLGEARTTLRAIRGQDAHQDDLVYIVDVFPSAPVTEGAVVPDGWQVGDAGVRNAGSEDNEPLLACPLFASRRLVDILHGTEWIELAWYRDGAWQNRVVQRALVATARTLVELADFGLPVNGHNAKEVVRYLADFENSNIEFLPRERVTGQMGWQGTDGEDGFLSGRQLITSNGVINPGDVEQQSITFRGADRGDEELVDGFHADGSFEVWTEGMQQLAQFPRVRLAVYAALSTVLLAVLDTFNYVLSYSGPTSGGKTTTLRVAASPWGRPNEQSTRASIGTWDSSRVWIERAAVVQCDHPLILDDTKRKKRPEDISQTIYDVASGRGRGRGSVDGVRSTGTFRTVLISSGEAPITSFTRDGGTRARVLEFWGSPFGAATAEIGTVVTTVNEVVRENHGHAGPRFAEFVAFHRARWPEWRESYRQLRRQYSERGDGNSVAMRMADHFALLQLMVHLAAEAGCVPWPADDLVAELWPTLTAETSEADQAATALRYAWNWAVANRESFHGQRSGSQHPPHGGWAGRWNSGSNWEFVGFSEPRIEHVLRDFGFEPEPILRSWRDRGWLRVSPGRRLYRARVDGVLEELVAVERRAIDELLGVDDDAANSDPRPRHTARPRRT